jgi:hypothetical protein
MFGTAPLLFFQLCSTNSIWSSSTVEFVEQVVLFDTRLCSSSRNGLFPCKWSIMPLIEIVLDIFREKQKTNDKTLAEAIIQIQIIVR